MWELRLTQVNSLWMPFVGGGNTQTALDLSERIEYLILLH